MLHVCVYPLYVFGACKVLTEEIDRGPGLETQVLMKYQVGAGNQTLPSAEQQCSNYWAISQSYKLKSYNRNILSWEIKVPQRSCKIKITLIDLYNYPNH